jgi:hypothetical protein
MGGGRRFEDDVPRRGTGEGLLRAAASLTSGMEASGGALAGTADFCSREHRLGFSLTDGRTPAAGEEVRLVEGSPLGLADAEGVFAVVDPGPAAALRACLDGEWAMTGRIAAFDLTTGRGMAIVTGEH